ncbi:xyloside xylosyltransferase 1 isoform X7 [Macaca fascicularis]|uniref:xyloside xylosyltransferase 1 isoform X7 n=2 Tax=Macaca TaxID=9539 RepID=UPI0032B08594
MQPSWLEPEQPPSCTMKYLEDGNEIKDNKGEKQRSSASLMTSWSSRALRGWLSHALLCVETVATREILRLIQLDLDLKFKTNIRELFEEFDSFLPGAIIGLAREMQPVYRHTFWQFRHENPQTRVGGPPPEGLPGFNSGVMLLNLEAMRQSPLYSRLLEPAQVQQLADKYHFRGHLGDQDFFTMIGMEHPRLFHVLDCTWNRQLCTWWRDHGYSDVFEAYFRCEGHVKIYHGNCNTPIPED